MLKLIYKEWNVKQNNKTLINLNTIRLIKCDHVIPETGIFLQSKALCFAKKLKFQDFKA